MKLSQPQQIHIKEYNYELPDHKIAKYPLPVRDSSKLLVYQNREIIDTKFNMLTDYLPVDSLLVFNNTKVIQARMHFQKETGAQIEVFCLEPYLPADYSLNFQQTQSSSWVCFIGNQRRWKEGKLYKKLTIDNKDVELSIERVGEHGDAQIIRFEWNIPSVTFLDILDTTGELPIPPYLNRETEDKDNETYQTVYSKIKGSVAAPTAGLHFTDSVFKDLEKKGFSKDEVTLHVGAGTFKPVKSDQIKDHEMHSEFISVRREFIENLLQHKGKVIAVGTTSVRTIESLYYIGELLETNNIEPLSVHQWQPYQDCSNQISVEKALQNILDYLTLHNETSLVADTQIIIAPGYTFKIVDGIVTNFHQPQSTLLLLVSAFVGDNKWGEIYNHALNNDYRFLSYGDSSLLLHD